MTLTSSSGASGASSGRVRPARVLLRMVRRLVVDGLLLVDDLVTAVCGAAPLGPRVRRAAARVRWAVADRYRAAADPDVVDAEVVETDLRRWL